MNGRTDELNFHGKRGMMSKQDELDLELHNLEQTEGLKSEDIEDTRRILAMVVRWQRCYGHGDVKLSAVGHRFSPKIRCNTVIDANKQRKQHS